MQIRFLLPMIGLMLLSTACKTTYVPTPTPCPPQRKAPQDLLSPPKGPKAIQSLSDYLMTQSKPASLTPPSSKP